MTDLERAESIIWWCRQHNAVIRFESNGIVSVSANGKRRRRQLLCDAVAALQIAIEEVV